MKPPYPPRELRRLRRLKGTKPLDCAILAPVVERTVLDVADQAGDLQWMLGGALAAQCYHESRVVLEIDIVVVTKADRELFIASCCDLVTETADGRRVFRQTEIPFDITIKIQTAKMLGLDEALVREWIEAAPVYQVHGRAIRVAAAIPLFCLLIKSSNHYAPYDAFELHSLHRAGTLDPSLYTPTQLSKAKEIVAHVERWLSTAAAEGRDHGVS